MYESQIAFFKNITTVIKFLPRGQFQTHFLELLLMSENVRSTKAGIFCLFLFTDHPVII